MPRDFFEISSHAGILAYLVYNLRVMVDIEKLALLARIKLGSNEKEKLRTEFEDVLNYISKLTEVDVEDVDDKEIFNASGLENVEREDKATNKPGEFSNSLLEAAPFTEGGYVKVKRALE